jgi:hypothetical protein
MTWLIENPMPVVYVTVLIEAILLGILVLTGRGAALIAMLGVAALAGVLLLIEHFVVTDVEVVEATLASTAQAIESNDADAVKQFIAPDNTTTRNRVDNMFDEFIIERVTIKGNLKIEVHDGSPKTAMAQFNAVATGGDKHGSVRGQPVPRFLKVWLRQDGDRWVITNHEDHDFREGLKKKVEQFVKGKKK